MALGHTFLVLMWKHWLIWWHYRIVTLIVVILPLTMSCILVYLNYNKEDMNIGPERDLKERNTTIYPIFDPRNVAKLKGRILYLPNSNASKSLLKKAFRNYAQLELVGVSSEDYIENTVRLVTSDSYNITAAIVFSDNFNGNNIPLNLKYKLRLPSQYVFENDKTYYITSRKKPRLNDDSGHSVYAKSGFLALQTLIDLAYIEIQEQNVGKARKQYDVNVRCMPYPSYVSADTAYTIVDLIPIIIVYGLIVLCPVIVKTIVDEKAARVKEMMKMMGTNTFVYWASLFVINFILVFISSVITTILFKIEFKAGSPVIGHSSSSLFLAILAIYDSSIILFCFVITTFFNRASVAMAVTVILWAVTFTLPSHIYTPLGEADTFVTTKYNVKIALCLLPNMAFNWAVKVMSAYDNYGIGSQWDNLFVPPFKGTDNFSLGSALGMMLVSCVLYGILLWYFDAVWPWQPGVPKPFYFCLNLSYWCSYQRKEDATLFIGRKTSYHEEEPVGLLPTVVISNLTKVFRYGMIEHKAVDNLSLNIYPGQITVLLGHNGAGKTTTMNILTGMFPPTNGMAVINGHDIVRQTRKARKSLGLCPQHNVLYDVLTVEEHLRLFAGLRGMSWKEMSKEAIKVMKLFDLEEKRDACSKDLSGGMKRKLCLGIAITGGSQVLILDEPTSGMDPEARRKVWDVLQEIRHEHTILLTTHHMEEADLLGDRVAIMARGFVQCCGSPIFLKGRFGAGYHLHVSRGENCKVDLITKIIKSHVIEAELVEDFGLELLYSLSSITHGFPSMFQDLEQHYLSLGIESCGITVTTMDDVFLKVGQITEALLEESIPASGSSFLQLGVEDEDILTPSSKSTGAVLLRQQMLALFVKRAVYAKRQYITLLIQGVLPTLIFSLLIWLDNKIRELLSRKTGLLNLDLKTMYGETSGFFHLNTQSTELFSLKTSYELLLKEEFVSVSGVQYPNKYLLQKAKENLKSYIENYLVGGSFAENKGNFSVTSWFNGVPHHLDPISINLMTTSILRYAVGNNLATIEISNHPLPAFRELNINIPNVEASSQFLYASFVPLAVTFLTSGFVLFPIHERTSKGKLLQRMSGVSATAFWLVNFIWDLLVHNTACLLLTIPFFFNRLINERIEKTAIGINYVFYNKIMGLPYLINSCESSTKEINYFKRLQGAIYVVLVFYGFPSIPATYIISYTSDLPSTGFALSIVIGIMTGMVACIIMVLLQFIRSFPREAFNMLLRTMRLFPHFTASWGINNIYIRSVENERCGSVSTAMLNEICSNPAKAALSRYFPCCPKSVCKDRCHEKKCYLCMDESAAGREVLALAGTGILYFILAVLLDSFLPKHWYIMKMKMEKYVEEWRNVHSPIEDSDVSDERQRVEKLFYGSLKEEALVIYNLTKYFGVFRAVNNISFAVRKKECFGLLGINGAGKTTTFRMLTGDLPPTHGNAHIENYNIAQCLQKFQMMVGYCPQYDALINQLTGREMLHLYANLRGIRKNEVTPHVDKMIEMCDLMKYADNLTNTYSGGTKRKLSLAIALIGSPPVVLLDEPTAGVDPTSRRKIWKTLTRMKRILGTSFVLTSHSMDECEALCTRIAIMVAGNLRCLGSMQHLKSKFGQGFTLVIKLKQEYSIYGDKPMELKNYIKEFFPSGELKDEHHGILHFHITDSNMKWSHMFSKMEEAKKKFQLENYLLSDTTLEQIFLAFAHTRGLNHKSV